MKKRFILTLFILFSILISGTGEAFVPQAPHLLHLVIKKIRKPGGIEARQTRKILNYEDTGDGFVEIEEKLSFLSPDKIRVDVISDTATNFSVESDSRFIRVKDGMTVSNDRSPVDLYTDILLYRDYESLLTRLNLAGIDTTRVSFQRYDDTICYVIGNPQEKRSLFVGLWIEKDTLLPVKYVIKKKGWLVEFFYKDWRKISRTWYPMKVNIFLDNQLFALIDVKNIVLKTGFSRSLFDIDHIRRLYPENDSTPFDENTRQVEELDKRIEDFKKLYE